MNWRCWYLSISLYLWWFITEFRPSEQLLCCEACSEVCCTLGRHLGHTFPLHQSDMPSGCHGCTWPHLDKDCRWPYMVEIERKRPNACRDTHACINTHTPQSKWNFGGFTQISSSVLPLDKSNTQMCRHWNSPYTYHTHTHRQTHSLSAGPPMVNRGMSDVGLTSLNMFSATCLIFSLSDPFTVFFFFSQFSHHNFLAQTNQNSFKAFKR